MEDDPVELRRLLLERHLQVLLPEEPRVRQPRGSTCALPSTIAAPPSARVDIGGADEVSAPACRPRRVQAKYFWLVAHGELDHLARHVEEGRVEAAEQRHRPFGEAGILGDQPFVLDQRQPGLGGSAACAPSRMIARALVRSTMTWQARSFSA